jgi:ankyrin repeat protein
MLLGRINDTSIEERPENMSRRAFYEYLYYEKPMKNKDWSPYYIKKYMDDVIFLERHINTRDKYGQTILFKLIDNVEPGDIAYLVHLGLDIDAQRNDGSTALFLSSLNDKSCKNTQALIDLGANINIKDKKGWPILAYVVLNSPKNILPFIKAGVDVNERGPWDITALMQAVSHSNIEAVEILIENGADPTLLDVARRGVLERCYDSKIRKIIEDALNK